MRQTGLVLAVALIPLILGCSPTSVATTPPIGATSSPGGDIPGRESQGLSPSITCADATPPALVDSIDGITARAIDRDHVEIANDTDATLYYELAGWEMAQLEDCVGILGQQIAYGPLAPRTSVTMTLGALADRPDVPITVGIWERPCGERCNRAPLARISLPRSPVEPASS
jgi:hypothetical protein